MHLRKGLYTKEKYALIILIDSEQCLLIVARSLNDAASLSPSETSHGNERQGIWCDDSPAAKKKKSKGSHVQLF